MGIVVYLGLVIMAICLAWLSGSAGHGSVGNVILLVVIIWGACRYLTRRLCLALGATGILGGIAGAAMIWGYGSFFIRGDPSGYGMLGTLVAYCCVPIGLALVVLGWWKNE